ncbi:hypothetical protein NDU88_007226 [Pleurodeles waltl]|uniref:Uncharacterized protein n=1 Tax=Pleurodeles waltl TaxID=8319 RepID=A0AAV7MFF4_PLEWA|nr:hypothetical protein NDU88_007226 [Pleurodeles waltl]
MAGTQRLPAPASHLIADLQEHHGRWLWPPPPPQRPRAPSMPRARSALRLPGSGAVFLPFLPPAPQQPPPPRHSTLRPPPIGPQRDPSSLARSKAAAHWLALGPPSPWKRGNDGVTGPLSKTPCDW